MRLCAGPEARLGCRWVAQAIPQRQVDWLRWQERRRRQGQQQRWRRRQQRRPAATAGWAAAAETHSVLLLQA